MENVREAYIVRLKELDFQFDNPVNSSVYSVDKLGDYIAGTNISPYYLTLKSP
jgi:hypothetical protein